MEPSPREQALAPFKFTIRQMDEKWEIVNPRSSGIHYMAFDDEMVAWGVAMTLNVMMGELYDKGVKDGFDIGWMAKWMSNSYL